MSETYHTYSRAYSSDAWIRVSEDTVFEKRPSRIEDWGGAGSVVVGGTTINFGDTVRESIGVGQAGWKTYYPKFQLALDAFIMQRTLIKPTFKQTCKTNTALHSMVGDILVYSTLTYSVAESLAVATIDVTSGAITEAGHYKLESVSVRDRGNSISDVTVSYTGWTPWIRLKIDPLVTES